MRFALSDGTFYQLVERAMRVVRVEGHCQLNQRDRFTMRFGNPSVGKPTFGFGDERLQTNGAHGSPTDASIPLPSEAMM